MQCFRAADVAIRANDTTPRASQLCRCELPGHYDMSPLASSNGDQTTSLRGDKTLFDPSVRDLGRGSAAQSRRLGRSAQHRRRPHRRDQDCRNAQPSAQGKERRGGSVGCALGTTLLERCPEMSGLHMGKLKGDLATQISRGLAHTDWASSQSVDGSWMAPVCARRRDAGHVSGAVARLAFATCAIKRCRGLTWLATSCEPKPSFRDAARPSTTICRTGDLRP